MVQGYPSVKHATAKTRPAIRTTQGKRELSKQTTKQTQAEGGSEEASYNLTSAEEGDLYTAQGRTASSRLDATEEVPVRLKFC